MSYIKRWDWVRVQWLRAEASREVAHKKKLQSSHPAQRLQRRKRIKPKQFEWHKPPQKPKSCMSIRYQIVSGSFRSPKYSQFPCDTQDWGVWTEKEAFQDFSSSIMHTTAFSYTLLYMRTDNYLFYSVFVDLLQTSISHTEQIHLYYTVTVTLF